MLPAFALLAPLLLAAPLPLACSGTCAVQGSALTPFIPPVLVLRSGSEVAWSGLDSVGHVNYEGLTNFDAEQSCVVATFAGADDDRVRFSIEGGALVAEHEGLAKPCASAAMLPDGGALLTYQCVLHPLTMKGALVVVP